MALFASASMATTTGGGSLDGPCKATTFATSSTEDAIGGSGRVGGRIEEITAQQPEGLNSAWWIVGPDLEVTVP